MKVFWNQDILFFCFAFLVWWVVGGGESGGEGVSLREAVG